jgi:predicted negative regulator of RcsB-dependent stress response
VSLPQHISRKDLKKDEVRDTLAHGAEALLEHQKFTIVLVIVAVLAAVGVYGWRTYAQGQSVKAVAAFNEAMTVFQAAVGKPQTPGQLAYADASKKYSDALRKFSGTATKYPRTRSGQLAAYYAALSDEKLNQDGAAKKWLQGLTGSKDTEVAAMAKFELAGIHSRTGQTDEAIKLYQQLIAAPTILVPKPVAMMALANCYRAKDPSQAAKLYGQIKTEYPDTPIADQADQALSLLPASKS